LKANNVYYFFPTTHGFGRSGIPDVVCCVAGKFLGIECKAGKNQPTELQKWEIDAIRASGGKAVVINEANLTTLGTLLKEMTDESAGKSY
jgi:Holliday junction resolvase